MVRKTLALLVMALPIVVSAQAIAFTFDDGLDSRTQPQARGDVYEKPILDAAGL